MRATWSLFFSSFLFLKINYWHFFLQSLSLSPLRWGCRRFGELRMPSIEMALIKLIENVVASKRWRVSNTTNTWSSSTNVLGWYLHWNETRNNRIEHFLRHRVGIQRGPEWDTVASSIIHMNLYFIHIKLQAHAHSSTNHSYIIFHAQMNVLLIIFTN